MSTQTTTSHEYWLSRKQYYQDEAVVATYDADRFEHRRHRTTTLRKWEMILKAFGSHFEAVDTVLDLPCGTGRFTRQLLGSGKKVVNCDISLPMLRKARQVAAGDRGLRGSLRCEAERVPLADDSVDAVVCIRFLFHVPRELRPGMLRELARISRRWVVLDVRHRYSISTHLGRLGAKLRGRPPKSERYTLKQLREDIAAGGLVIRRKVWKHVPFSEKLVLLCEKQGPC